MCRQLSSVPGSVQDPGVRRWSDLDMGSAASMRVGAASLLMVLAPGCGGGGGSDGDVPFNRLAAGYATALCHKDVVCCEDSELGIIPNPDRATIEATCRTNLADAWAVDLAPYAALISSGQIVYRGDHARLCFDEIAAQPCADWGASTYLEQYPDCRLIFEGPIALGGACATTEDCADGVCKGSSGTGVCTARGRIDEPCNSSYACEPELNCLHGATGGFTVCATPLQNGATCYHDADCADTFCEANVCSPPTMCNGI
jgi:hypothetical protein